MNFIELTFVVEREDEADIISALLEDTGYIGSEFKTNSLHICYEEDAFPEQDIMAVCKLHQLSYQQNRIPQQNWNEAWESSFQPIEVNTDLIVRASFHPPAPQFKWELIITPKMSFGTGHHATTQLMLRAILNLNCVEARVLDYGCGTGVLAIMAAKLGATQVVGIDIDDWCIENSIENASLNHITAHFFQGNIDQVEGGFDLILANINLNILRENMTYIDQRLVSGGVVLFSGILETDLESILESIESVGLQFISKEILNGWMCLKVLKPERRLA